MVAFWVLVIDTVVIYWFSCGSIERMEVDIVTESKQNTAVVVATRGNNFCYHYRRRLIGMRGCGSSRTVTLILRASKSGGAGLKYLIALRSSVIYHKRQIPCIL